MQRVLDTQEGAFHIHMHDFSFFPAFSKVDRESLERLIPSFKHVGQHSIHGALLFTNNNVSGIAWLPDHARPIKISRIAIIGRPLVIY